MNARVTSSTVWTHAFGQMRIDTLEDGSVLVDGRPVHDTVPVADAVSTDPSTPFSDKREGERSESTADQEEGESSGHVIGGDALSPVKPGTGP